MPVTAQPRPLVTVEQLAERWNVSKTLIYKLSKRTGPARLPSIRFGRSLRFDEDALERWVTEHGSRTGGESR